MPRRWTPRRRALRRESDQTRALAQARRASHLTFVDAGRALGVHPRTVARWELGESTPKESLWPSVLAFYAARVPQHAQALAAAVGRPLPSIRTSSTVDVALAGHVVARTADALDVAPRRVREVLLATARAALESGMGFEGLMRTLLGEAALEGATGQDREARS